MRAEEQRGASGRREWRVAFAPVGREERGGGTDNGEGVVVADSERSSRGETRKETLS